MGVLHHMCVCVYLYCCYHSVHGRKFLLSMPLNTTASLQHFLGLSSLGPLCIPCLNKAAAGWVLCPDTDGWCVVRFSRHRHSLCCPRCPDELRCGVDTTLCQAAGSAAIHRLNSGSLPLQKLDSSDTGPDKLHPLSSVIWRDDHVAALSKIKSIVKIFLMPELSEKTNVWSLRKKQRSLVPSAAVVIIKSYFK